MKVKHVPLRTCAGCRQVKPKRELVRIVHSPNGRVAVDSTGKQPGRGVYVCANKECWDAALKRERLDKALRTAIPKEERDSLAEDLRAVTESKRL